MDTIERNRAAMKRFETAINTCDDALAAELVAPDAPFFTPVSEEPLYGGAGYLEVVRFMRASFPDVQWHMEDMAVDAQKAAVWWTCSGTHLGEFMGHAPTGKTFSFSVMNFYYFNDEGRIVRDVAAEGLIGLFRALGLKP